MATTVRITETYDLKTTVNKMGLIGIHTPADSQIRRLYPGLMENHEFIRFLKCDVVGACASVLPADPLSVGVSEGDVAPEDLFNPILYKAVTNESFDNLVSAVYDASRAGALGSVNAGETDGSIDAWNAYYAMLSDNHRFRKSMPQMGFRIKGLVPICHTLISTYGNVNKPGNKLVKTENPELEGDLIDTAVPELSSVPVENAGLNQNATKDSQVVFKGRSVRMPKIPLHYTTEGASDGPQSINIPETFVLAMIVPPARLHEFYYRMRVTWTIRFERPISRIRNFGGYSLASTASYVYYKNYNYSRAVESLPEKTDTVDVDGVDINKIMEA